MGRYGFGILAIFGEEPKLEMRGVYLFRSTEIPFFVIIYLYFNQMTDHPSFEYYKTRKLDPKNPEDQKIVEDFWASEEENMVLGLRYREGKYFR